MRPECMPGRIQDFRPEMFTFQVKSLNMPKSVLLIMILLLGGVAPAQDRHYWSQMGGITAGLLGGAGVAGLRDNSSMYYNPAAMSYVNNPSISLGANTYRLRMVNIDNAFGDNLDKTNTGFVINPDLIGGLLFSKKDDRIRFGYFVATRFLFNTAYSQQANFINSQNETLIASFDLNNQIQETWVGAANSFKVNEHFAYGYSLILAVRTQNYFNYIGSRLVPATSPADVSRFDSNITYNYWNAKGLLRLSMALDYSRFRFGWTLTLPSLNLLGQANIKREFSLVNNPNPANSLPKDILLTGADYQVRTLHKYPLSSALGASFRFRNRDWLHLTAEFFLPVKKYQIFSSELAPIAYPQAAVDSILNNYFPGIRFLELPEEAGFVVNFAAGYESYLTDNWGLLAGFRTDFNFNNTPSFELGELRPYYTQWDIYYLSFGAWGIFKNKKITAGLEVGLTPATRMRQLINFDNPDSPDYPLLGTPNNSAVARQLLLRLFLGIEIDFPDDQQAGD